MNKQQTDARISHDGLLWHFQNVVDHAKLSLNHLEFQLKYSKDFDGTSHRKCVEAIIDNMREHIEAMEAFIEKQNDIHKRSKKLSLVARTEKEK
jgi:hypothetical protein